ncbi:aspartyl-phosphate phosphatase Spo0E family protein [Paenibacillus azoreducens]|uniref:aspartyl-phosphate phosphatase Spo0E family protein n=1 Tax=Paenibacillus azoreducens TaxID=116718 RepID=UPI0039F5DB67
MVNNMDLKIEELRLELNKLSLHKRLTDPELINASQNLDRALNDYQKLLKEKK